MTRKQGISILAIVAIGLVLGALILLFAQPPLPGAGSHGHAESHGDTEHHGETDDDHDHAAARADGEHHEEASKAGPHGGQLFSERDFELELKLVEADGVARFQAWLLQSGKPLAPTTAQFNATLARPNGDKEEIRFTQVGDSMQSVTPVAEPHLFEGTLAVQIAQAPYLFTFSHSEGKIPFSDAQLGTAGVALATAGPARINSSVQLAGGICFNEDRTAHVVPRITGIVEKVHVDLGQQVKRGQILATIASTELSEQRSRLRAALQRLELARETHAREKQLWEEKISAQQDFLQAQQALREAEIEVVNARQKLAALGVVDSSGPLNRYELRAPFDAMVVEKHISMGETVKEDANVFTLSDLSMVWAEIVVPAKDLNRVRVGENVVVRATAFESQAAGKISYVGNLLGEQTRAAKARVTLANPELAWRPGLFVNVEVIAEQSEIPVAIESDAVQIIEGRTVVFVRVPGGFVPQPVELGRSNGNVAEVRTGLQAGVQYASAGSFVIKSELGKATAEHTH